MGKAKNKKKKSKRKNKAPPEPTVPEGSTASAAAQYLQQWALQQQPAGERPSTRAAPEAQALADR